LDGEQGSVEVCTRATPSCLPCFRKSDATEGINLIPTKLRKQRVRIYFAQHDTTHTGTVYSYSQYRTHTSAVGFICAAAWSLDTDTAVGERRYSPFILPSRASLLGLLVGALHCWIEQRQAGNREFLVRILRNSNVLVHVPYKSV
jgi:hypothetical protein